MQNKLRTDLLTSDELSLLKTASKLKASIKRMYSYETLLEIDTGAKFDEINDLTWNNLDLPHNTFTVRGQIKPKKVRFSKDTSTYLSVLKMAQEQAIKHSRAVFNVPPYIFDDIHGIRPTELYMGFFITETLNSSVYIPFECLRNSILDNPKFSDK